MFAVLAALPAVAAALAGCSGGPADGSATAPPAQAEPRVAMQDFVFKPASLTVPAGTMVTWTNFDPAGHTVTPTDGAAWGTAGSGEDDSQWLQKGQSWSWTFSKPGTYEYYCTPHAAKGSDGNWRGMVGTIVVT